MNPALAELHYGKAIGAALTAAIIPLLLSAVRRSAQISQNVAGQNNPRSITYPAPMRAFVVFAWVGTLGLAGLCGFLVKDASIWGALVIACIIGPFALALHLEVFKASITWDDANIYVRSWTGKRRTIPLQSVKSCDFSGSGGGTYTIHTAGHGELSLNAFMCGVPDLFAILPCQTPPFPPDLRRKTT